MMREKTIFGDFEANGRSGWTASASLRLGILAILLSAWTLGCAPEDVTQERVPEDEQRSLKADAGADPKKQDLDSMDVRDAGGEGAAEDGGGDLDQAADQLEPIEPRIRILSPATGSVLTGLADVELEAMVPEGEDVGVFFGIDEDNVTEVRHLDGLLQVKSQNVVNGEHELIARIVDADGAVYEDRLDVVVDNPTQQLLQYELTETEYGNGEEIELALEFSEAGLDVEASFADVDSEFVPADVSYANEDELVVVRYPIRTSNTREDGPYVVGVTAVNTEGRAIVFEVPIELRNVPRLPVSVSGGSFVDGPLAGTEGGPSSEQTLPQITEVTGDAALLSGGSATLTVRYTESADNPADKLIVRAPGYSGYYVVPLGEDHDGEIQLEVSQLALEPEAFEDLSDFTLELSITDLLGAAARFAAHTLALLDVGDSTVGATLTWDTPADLDLAVITPDMDLLDFETPSVGNGKLNLDSNALCEDGLRAENIAWPLGEAPIGEFKVVVNMYEACGVTEPTTFRLKTNACGKSEIITGTIAPGAEDMSGTGTVRATFEVDCTHVLRGKVSYEKRNTIRPAGASSASTSVVLANAPIRVHNADNDAEINETLTDATGNYTLSFFNPTDTDFYISAEAIWNDTAFGGIAKRVRVTPDADDTPYRSRSVALDGARNANANTLDLHISEPNNAGAFNIRDIVVKGFEWVNARAPSAEAQGLGPLRARWGRGVPMEITDRHGVKHELSYQIGRSLFMNGSTDDQDEWDDTVIMHEFMHYVIRNLVYSPLPGGPHSGRSKPDIAWSEGLATGLGQFALGDPVYVSENLTRAFSHNVEKGTQRSVRNMMDVLGSSAEAPIPNVKGTDPANDVKGRVHEILISGVIWDMLDGIDRTKESFDRFDTTTAQFVLNVLFAPPTSGSYVDREGNGVDLADFLDHFIVGSHTMMNQQLFCLTDAAQYPYDQYPAALTTCPP